MTLAEFDSRMPVQLTVGELPTLPRNGFVGFSDTYGSQTVEITNRHANVVDTRRLSDLVPWFTDSHGRDADIAAIAGQVVHWPIGKQCDQHDLVHAFDMIGQALVAAQPETACQLDRVPLRHAHDYAWVIFGPDASNVRVHQDMLGTASWNYLVSGRKQWSFWAPDSLPGVASPTHCFNQTPGDLIWIPEGWWHAVRYMRASICLSRNLVPARAAADVARAATKDAPRLAAILSVLAQLDSAQVA